MEEPGIWDKARLNGLRAKHAATWLEGVPCQSLGNRMSGEEFRSRMGRWLGLELGEEKPCPLCFEVLDTFGAHAEGCMGGGDAVTRQNTQRDNLHKQAKAAATRPELEKTRILARALGNASFRGRRPADTLLYNTSGIRTARGRQMAKIALVVGVINPQALSHINAAARKQRGAAAA